MMGKKLRWSGVELERERDIHGPCKQGVSIKEISHRLMISRSFKLVGFHMIPPQLSSFLFYPNIRHVLTIQSGPRFSHLELLATGACGQHGKTPTVSMEKHLLPVPQYDRRSSYAEEAMVST